MTTIDATSNHASPFCREGSLLAGFSDSSVAIFPMWAMFQEPSTTGIAPVQQLDAYASCSQYSVLPRLFGAI